MLVGRLIGIGREEPPSRKTLNEPDIDGRSLGLETAPIGGGLGQRTAELSSVFVEYQYVRRERVIRSKLTTRPQRLVVADAGQAVPGFKHVYLEVVRVAAKGDPGWGVQAGGENRRREPRRKN